MKELIKQALAARERSYCPYSGFAVGAALLAEDGSIFTGCNIENAAFTPTNCAERTAFFKAVSEGQTKFRRIAVVGGEVGKPLKRTVPCGVCLQVMLEFCAPGDFEVIFAVSESEYEVRKLEELLPYGFQLEE